MCDYNKFYFFLGEDAVEEPAFLPDFGDVDKEAEEHHFKDPKKTLRGFFEREGGDLIAIFTVARNFSHLHYNVFEYRYEAILGRNSKVAQNSLTSMFKYIVMQMRKVNCEKGYSFLNISAKQQLLISCLWY